MRRSGRGLGRLLLLGAAAACFAACSFDFAQLAFTKDNRLTILSPRQNALVKPPVELRWRIRDFTIAAPGSSPPTRNAGYFAIFVDRAPVRPGQTLAAVGGGDPTCRQSPKYCLSPAYLHGQQVYTTTSEHYSIRTVSDIAGNNLATQYHTATIVLLNTAGQRIGESAWSVSFKMHAQGEG